MNIVHIILEIIGAVYLIGALLLILGACCIGGRREDLSKFGRDPFEPKLVKIRKLPWGKL